MTQATEGLLQLRKEGKYLDGSANTAPGSDTKNWKNPGNWHWVEKNVFGWAHEYLKDRFAAFKVGGDDQSSTFSVSSLETCKGDVNVCMRKGKILYIFDLRIKLQWECSGGSLVGKGAVEYPEVMHDTDPMTFEREISITSCEGGAEANNELRRAVQQIFIPGVAQIFENFRVQLEKTHGPELIVKDTHQSPLVASRMAMQRQASSAEQKANQEPLKDDKDENKDVSRVKTTSLSITSTYRASATDLYSIWTDPARVKAWTRDGNAQVEPREGGKFRLLHGNVEGSFEKLVSGSEILMLWRVQSWPKAHFCNVGVKFVENAAEGMTTLELNLTKVPCGEEETIRKNFEGYYINAQKATFGLELFF